ncbi:hypothetical protein FRC17_004659 [Serendipita sp. 399]|nr:hypothetical protein FRC17_004659 [Serendipita sp. 399]
MPDLSDYKGLKKKISAIQEQRRRSPKFGDNTLKSLNERIRSGSIFLPSPMMRRRAAAESRTGVTGSAPPVTTRLSPGRSTKTASTSPNVRDAPGTTGEFSSISRSPGVRQAYGTFSITPPFSTSGQGQEQRHNVDPSSPPEMLLPPPIKSISDLRINEAALPLGERSGKTRVTLQDTATENTPANQNVGPTATPGTRPSPRRPRLFTSLSVATRRSPVSTQSHLPTTLAEALAGLTPLEQEFIQALDAELAKVENFYREREKEAIIRSSVIKAQLNELKDHRKIFHAYEEQHPPLPKVLGKMAAHIVPQTLSRAYHVDEASPQASEPAPSTSRQRAASPHASRLDPEEYQNAKKGLKRVMLEFYRGVEYLSNYRILNLTGFRKALKKFEKGTTLHISHVYFAEKIDPSIISNSAPIDDMLEEVERLFAARFEGGDRKKARSRLRAHFTQKSHHYSTFRTGLMIGLSVPALAAGIYQSFQTPIREVIPAWSALLQIYLAFFIPVIFGLLVSLNLIIWAHVRINYIFIFELDVRTVVDSREYAEVTISFLQMIITDP